jgi:hypothetical protein
MKKAIVIIALIAMIIVPVAAKSILPSSEKGGFAVGLELGQPSGITFDYKIDSKWDGYITAAFGFGSNSYIDAVLGGQYKVTDFNIDKAKFDVNVGLQAGALIYLGNANGIALAFRGTGSISYDWSWKNVGDFTAYLRAGVGYAIGLSESVSSGITFNAALGCVYHL